MGSAASSAEAPALEDVVAAEAAAKEAARTHFAAAIRAKHLRLAHTIGTKAAWIGLRATQGGLSRFLDHDRPAAMKKHAWFRRQVKNRTCPGYALYDYDLGCHGWMVADEGSADVFLQRLDDGAYTLTSEFRTRYDMESEETLRFRELDEFLAKFPHVSSLNTYIEERAEERARGSERHVEEDDDDSAEGKRDESGDDEDDNLDEPLEQVALSLVESRVWSEESRRVERATREEVSSEEEE